MFVVTAVTPLKFNMEPENQPMEKESPFGNQHFQVPAVKLWGCIVVVNDEEHEFEGIKYQWRFCLGDICPPFCSFCMALDTYCSISNHQKTINYS